MGEMFTELNSVRLNKLCNALQSEDKKQRKQALVSIRKEIIERELDDIALVSSYDHVQMHLLRCFQDDSEACREYAVSLVHSCFDVLPSNEQYLFNLIPAINKRIGGDKIRESSEEVRLLLVAFLRLVVAKYKSHLPPFIDDFIQILVKTIIDPYPKVKKESCECASDLAKAIPRHFHLQSESLISPLLATLKHQQYRIRIAGISTIGDVVRYGNGRAVNDVCGPLAERLFDQTPMVRLAVTRVVGCWLVDLPDRYSYFPKLIPLMLTCLSDELPEQREEAFQLWDKAGRQYMDENESDLKDKMDFLDESLEYYPEDVHRPNLGCRTLVQREMSKYLPGLVRELDDWMVDVRVKSAQLLCVTAQHCEANIAQHLAVTLPAMYRACADADARVVENVVRAAAMIGFFVPPNVYCSLILPALKDTAHYGVPTVLAQVITTSRRHDLCPHLSTIAGVLQSDEVCQSRQSEYQIALVRAAAALVAVGKQDCVNIGQQLFTLLVTVIGLSVEQRISDEAQAVLVSLSGCHDQGSGDSDTLANLYGRYTGPLLEVLRDGVGEWSLQTPQRFVFEAILTHAGAAVGLNRETVLTMLKAAVQPHHDPEMVLKMLMAVSHILLQRAVTLPLAPAELNAFLHTIIVDVLSEQLVWRAGRSAEALRTAAASCTLIALDCLVAEPVKPTTLCSEETAILRLEELITLHPLLTHLTPLLLGLVDDAAHKTRILAARSLCTLVRAVRDEGALAAKDINAIFPVILKRLDDNNDQVRMMAVRCLRLLFCAPLPPDYDVVCSSSHLECLYTTMLVHLDDHNTCFQSTMLGNMVLDGTILCQDALKEVATASPKVLRQKIVAENFRDKDICDQLIGFLEDNFTLSTTSRS